MADSILRAALAAILVPLLLFCLPAYASNGIEDIAVTVEQLGLGGAFVATPPDTGALMGNPAALAFYEFPEFSLDARSWNSKLSLDAALGGTGQSESTLAPGFAYASPGQGRFAWGAGVFTMMNSAYRVHDYDMSLIGAPPGTTDRTSTKVRMVMLAPAVAMKLNDDTAVGLGLQYTSGTADFQAYDAFGNTVGLSLRDMTGKGHALRAGIYSRATEDTTLGAYWRSRTHLEITGGVMETGAMSETPGAVIPGVEIVGFNFPEQYGVGFGHKLNCNWTAYGEYRRLMWGKGSDHVDFVPPQGDPTGYQNDWENQDVYILAAEYRPEGEGGDTWRMGVNYGKSPIPDHTLRPLYPAVSEWHYTAGYEHEVSDDFSFSLGAMYAPQVTRTSSMDNAFNQAIGLGQPFSLSNEILEFGIGLTWKFGNRGCNDCRPDPCGCGHCSPCDDCKLEPCTGCGKPDCGGCS